MVLVQGVREVDGIPYLIVRDPAPGRGAYLQRVVDFEPGLYPTGVGFPIRPSGASAKEGEGPCDGPDFRDHREETLEILPAGGGYGE